jgi:hypothetical protein
MDSIRKFKSFIRIEVCYHSCHCHWCTRVGDSKGEQQFLMTNGEGEFDQKVLVLVIILEQNMNNFLRHTMEAIVQWF